jgi:phosphoribosylglycinamide formyltransferase 1
MYRIGWFATGRGPGGRALLTAAHEAMRRGDVPARIEFVFLNREPGEYPETDKFIELVRSYNLPLVCYSYQKFKAGVPQEVLQAPGFPAWRLAYDREVMTRLEGYQAELSVLAGYMLIVGPEMCRRFTMINLHPALPTGPKGTWQDVIWQLIAEQARETGVMMHLVTPALDRGPVVSFCRFSIRGPTFNEAWRQVAGKDSEAIKKTEGEQNELFRLIRAHGFKRELPLIVTTIKAFAEGRVRIAAEKVVDQAGKPLAGADLSREIDFQVQ